MSLKALLNCEGDTTINWLYVNILEMLTGTLFMVADVTGVAIMQVDERTKENVQLGQGIKLSKVRKIGNDCFVVEGCAMKTKPMMLMMTKANQLKMDELRQKALTDSKTEKKYRIVKEIINEFEENANVDSILVLVSTISRLINGRFGDYRILKIIDATNTTVSMNLYYPNLDKLEENQVFILTNLKKMIMKHDGSVRLSTTRFTKIKPANSDEEKLFDEYKVAKPVIEGCCIMYTDLVCYKSCPVHKTKLKVDGYCAGCEKKRSDPNNDFRCVVHIETSAQEDLIPILIFKSVISSKMSSENPEEALQKMINQKMKIRCTKKGENHIHIASKVE